MNTKFNKIATLLVGGSLMLGAIGCTDKFEDFNTDPKAPTPEQMEGDFAATATLLGTMIPSIVQGQENNFQMLDQMIGCEFGRMGSAKNAWGGGATVYACYNPPMVWTGNMFDTTMPQIYTPFFRIRDLTDSDGLTYFWASLIRVAASLRISDCYGPIPFSKIGDGSDFQVAYDDMPTLYNAMFEELDKAIAGLKLSVGSTTSAQLFGNVDYIYGGDIARWVKLGNTVKLRMAMRLVNVEPALAQRKAEEAVADEGGLIAAASDAAWSSFLPGGNAFHKVSDLWGEDRFSADLESYLKGYNDPRLEKYAKPAADGQIHGARSGYVYGADYNAAYSLPNVSANDKLLCIAASESWFMRAEGALRGWNMGGTAKELYEKGVTVSFEERGVALGDYLNSTAIPADHVDALIASNSISAQSAICPKWNDSGVFAENLERIIVQKWLGNYPNGWETWADFRRVNFPKFFPVVTNKNTDGVTTKGGMRRLPFPLSEFNTNAENVKAAQGMLGGPDTGATNLWWASSNY